MRRPYVLLNRSYSIGNRSYIRPRQYVRFGRLPVRPVQRVAGVMPFAGAPLWFDVERGDMDMLCRYRYSIVTINTLLRMSVHNR